MARDRRAIHGERMKHPVYFTPEMVATVGATSPSAAKPAQVVAAWRALDLPIELCAPAPVTVDQLCRAHDRAHVLEILDGRRANGFGTTSPEVAASLPYTSGAMLAAARRAIADRGVACAPVSGFHHAGYASAGGFCTFNGLAVAALALHDEDGAGRVGILDCDMHYGDGTDDIIERLGLTWLAHYTAGEHFHLRKHAAGYLRELAPRAAAMRDCDVVLYQAGADPHVDDPLGGVLTSAELAERDRIVFDTLGSLGVPVAWNFAGGYQQELDGTIPKVIEIHTATLRAALATR